MAELQFPPHVEKELETLHLRFEAKRGERPPETSDKDVFKEVFRERFEELKTGATSPVPATNRADDATDAAVKSEREKAIEGLVRRAFDDPSSAVAEAIKRGGYFVDELHDRLHDEYFEKFMQFRKLKSL